MEAGEWACGTLIGVMGVEPCMALIHFMDQDTGAPDDGAECTVPDLVLEWVEDSGVMVGEWELECMVMEAIPSFTGEAGTTLIITTGTDTTALGKMWPITQVAEMQLPITKTGI